MIHRILSFFILTAMSLQTLANDHLDKIKIIKYDRDRDGLAELLVAEYRDTQIVAEIKGGKMVKFHVERDFKNKFISKTTYELQNDKFVLINNFSTKDRIFYNVENCNDSQTAAGTNIDAFDIFMDVIEEPSFKFEASCSTQQQNRIKDSLKAISDPGNEPFTQCVGKFNGIFQNKLLNLPGAIQDVSINCNQTPNPKGSFEKDASRMSISQTCFSDPKELRRVVLEETMHAIGSLDEEFTKCLIEKCPDTSSAEKCIENTTSGKNRIEAHSLLAKTNFEAQGRIAVGTPSNSPTPAAQERINNNQKINVPSQIAAGSVPQPQISDFRTGQSVSSTYEPVGGNSFGNSMMRLAQNTILPDKAFAAESEPTRLANNNSGGTRAPANTNNAANSQWMNSGVAKSVGTGTNLQMPSGTVEEPGTSGSSAGGNQKVAGQPSSEAKNARGGTVGSVAGRAGTVAMTGGGGSGGRSLASTGSGSENSASAFGANSAKSFVNLKRSELVQTLNISANYPDYQQNLKNGEFNETLKENFIRIKDAKGVEHGFTEAEEKKFKAKLKPSDRAPRVIIYADTGRRLINNTRVTNNAP